MALNKSLIQYSMYMNKDYVECLNCHISVIELYCFLFLFSQGVGNKERDLAVKVDFGMTVAL